MSSSSLGGLFILGKSAFNNTKSLYELFEEDALVQVLRELGDIAYEAAIQSLMAVSNSSNPRNQVREAIGHFRIAYLSFYRSAKKSTAFWVVISENQNKSKRIRLCYKVFAIYGDEL